MERKWGTLYLHLGLQPAWKLIIPGTKRRANIAAGEGQVQGSEFDRNSLFPKHVPEQVSTV